MILTLTRWVQHVLAARLAGQAIVWVAVMLPFFLSVIGLTIDGGIVFSARRELQNVADGAARAGAMQVDQRVYRETAGTKMVLSTQDARQVAATYVAGQSSQIQGLVGADPQQVTVRVQRQVPTSFLRLVGLNTVEIAATATARVRYGIERANG